MINLKSIRKYYTPTAIIARRIGDAILIITAGLTEFATSARELKIIMFVGITGKLLLNFFPDRPYVEPIQDDVPDDV